MDTITLTSPQLFRSSDCSLEGPDIAFLSETCEVGFTDYPPMTDSVVSLMLEGWWGHTGFRTIPAELLRRKLRLALFGQAPDRRTAKTWQREVDQLIADAVNSGDVQLVKGRR